MSNDFALLNTTTPVSDSGFDSTTDRVTVNSYADSDAADHFSATIAQNTLSNENDTVDPTSVVFDIVNTAIRGPLDDLAVNVTSAVYDIGVLALEHPEVDELVKDIAHQVHVAANRHGGLNIDISSDDLRTQAKAIQTDLQQLILLMEKEYRSIETETNAMRGGSSFK